MKSKIICLVLSLVFVTGMLAGGGTYAWFMTYGDAAGGILHNFSSGNIGYTIVGGFKDSASTGLIEPEMELLADIDTSVISDPGEYKMFVHNTSTIDTQLRVKLTYTYFDENGDVTSFVYDGAEDSPFFADLAEGWVCDADGYIYYGGADSIIADVSEGSGYIPLFSSLRYSGENSDFRSDWYNEDGVYTVFSVNVIFEAKQAEYVDWETIGSVGFETYPAESGQTS